MRLAGRLQRLERRARFIGSEVCSGCGAPVPGVNLYVALNEDGEPRWGRCTTCGLALDERGRPCAAFPLQVEGAPVACKYYGPGASVEVV